MKTSQDWFAEYAESHQNKTNQAIHYICVPAIYFAIIGMLTSIDESFLTNLFQITSFSVNWAMIAIIIVMIFYLRLSFFIFVKMLIFSVICIIGNNIIKDNLPLFYTSLTIFIIAWIGQFYGHHLEGKKPSFLKDIQFLLIGPIWVIEKTINK